MTDERIKELRAQGRHSYPFCQGDANECLDEIERLQSIVVAECEFYKAQLTKAKAALKEFVDFETDIIQKHGDSYMTDKWRVVYDNARLALKDLTQEQ